MTKLTYFLPLILAGFACSLIQKPDPRFTLMGSLPGILDECSGMERLEDDLYVAHNDGGSPAVLYVFSLKKKSNLKVVHILGAENNDWEELAADDTHIYIGDTGNNNGSRKNLAIYKVLKKDIMTQREARAEKISFSYSEQKDFKSGGKHNFDCEAMICAGGHLYLFTKNRENEKTDLYQLPAIAGNYEARHLDRFDAEGLVTGADFRTSEDIGELVLVGYKTRDKGYHPFLIWFSNIHQLEFFRGDVHRYVFEGTLQTETVIFHDGPAVFISNEASKISKGLIQQVILTNQ